MALTKSEIEQHAAQAFDRPQSLEAVLFMLANLDQLPDHADDTAAGNNGVPIGGLYRSTSTLKVRVA